MSAALLIYLPLQTEASMIPDKAPEGDVFLASEDLKKDAHVPSFEKYKELYTHSVENPGGRSKHAESKLQWQSLE